METWKCQTQCLEGPGIASILHLTQGTLCIKVAQKDAKRAGGALKLPV